MKRTAALVILFAVVLGVTVWLFLHFDSTSHSASDTLRPFVITAVPLWLIAAVIAAASKRRSIARL